MPITCATTWIVVLSLLLPQPILGQTNGALTIFAVPDHWYKYQEFAECLQSNLSIRIDKGDTVPWPRKGPLYVKDLALDQSHLVTVRCAGKPLHSVKFRFSRFEGVHVCVIYDAKGGLFLFDHTRRGWGCKKESPTSGSE